MQENNKQKIVYLTFFICIDVFIKTFRACFSSEISEKSVSLQTFANIIFLNRINKFYFADIQRLRAESKGKKKKIVIEINVVLL